MQSGKEVQEVAVDQKFQKTAGVGLESQDIDKMTKMMITDILSQSFMQEAIDPPKVVIDSKTLINESSQVINTSLLADRLRVNLMREAKGNLLFVSRENMKSVMEEAQISDQVSITKVDYRLTGRITSLSSFSNNSGMKSNFVQIAYELIDLKTAVVVWSNLYQVKKVGADDTIYR